MDITPTLAPNSDQLNADDLMGGPVTVTVENVTKGSREQPVNIHLVEYPGRPYRPGKTMRRVIAHLWGAESSAYVGRRLTLYRDPNIKFGRDTVGGIRISHMSHIKQAETMPVTVTRGKRAPYTVEPLQEPAGPSLADVEACTDLDQLRALYQTAAPDVQEAIKARAAALQGGLK